MALRPSLLKIGKRAFGWRRPSPAQGRCRTRSASPSRRTPVSSEARPRRANTTLALPCQVKSFATLEGDPESAKLTEHEFEDVLTALAEAELIVGRLHGKGYTLGGNLQNIYVCPCQLAGAGRSPVKKILAVYPPSHGTSMHNHML